MRQRKILKLLIFGMVFMLFSCVNDEVINKMEHVHSNKTEIVTINKVPIIITSIQKFNQNYRLLSKEDLTNNTSSIENLNLDLNHILVYTKLNNGYTSYSIPIINPIPNGQAYYFENLHVIGNNENSFIYRWTPQDKNIPFSLKTYTGKLEKFDIDYNLKISDNYINGISQPKTNRLSNKSGGDNEMGEVEIDCSTASACTCQGKGDNYCGCDPKDDMYKSYCVSSLYIYCYLSGGGGTGGEGGTGEGGTGEGGGGEGGGGGGGSTGDTGTGDGGTGDTGTGPVDPIDQPIDEVVPIVVEEEITPCVRMKTKSGELKFKQKIKELNTTPNYNKRFETGYYEKADRSFNFMTGIDESGKRTLNFPTGATSFMHIHMNDVEVQDENGNPYFEFTIKMLSPGDVGSLIGSAGNAIQNGLDPLNSYGLMLSNEGIFSVSLTDTNIAMSNTLKANMDKEYSDQAKIILKRTSPNSSQRKKLLQIMLLKLLKDKGFGDKVTLFEAEVVTEPGQTLPTINWTKKTLDTNNLLIEEPC